MQIAQSVAEAFKARHGRAPEFVVAAPGRVNLIGDHTDYNDGFVMPLAIDRWVTIALAGRDDGIVSVNSLDFDTVEEFDLASFGKEDHGWIEYVKGVAWALKEDGHELKGFDGVLAGDVPHGAGLSSSAALELAVACSFERVSGFAWDPIRMALVGQKAENGWVGMNCGIMDQLISAAGVEGHALLIDCRSLTGTPVPLPEGTTAVVLDTATSRGLVDSAYNERRSQCEAGAAHFGVKALRDVNRSMLVAEADGLDSLVLKRVRHIVTENHRVEQAAEAMQQDNARLLGTLMNESHESLRDDFEVSAEGLNIMTECAQDAPGCYGARMTGAGFGGCCVALVKTAMIDAFIERVAKEYESRTGKTPAIYPCRAVKGAAPVDIELSGR